MTRDTEKCPLSVLTGVRISGLIFEKIYELFVGTNETVLIKRVSVERGSTVLLARLTQWLRTSGLHIFKENCRNLSESSWRGITFQN